MDGTIEHTISSDLETIVSKSAPLLGSVLLSPFASIGLTLLCSMFHVEPNNIQQLMQEIINDPDSAAKLRQIEIAHIETLQQVAFKNYEASINDRANAREREEKIIQLTGKRDWVIDFIAMVVIVGFFAFCLLGYFLDIADENLISLLIGQMSGGFLLVLSYYFGSTNKGT